MKLKMTSRAALLAAPILLFLAACGADETASQAEPNSGEETRVAKIEGEVFYRERMMLPPDAEVEVQLQDISRADAMATVMSSTTLKPNSGPPYSFAIEYKPDEIDSRMRYALRATIRHGERLLFTSTEYIDPFAGNPIQVMVQRVGEPIDRAKSPKEPGHPAAEAALAQADAEQSDEGPSPAVWELQTLSGEPAPAGAGGNPAVLTMNPDDNSASGFSGCNRFSGAFRSEGSSAHGTPIKFGPLASTRRACADTGELEQAYLKMLGNVDSYRMEGSSLELLQGDKIVATFTLM